MTREGSCSSARVGVRVPAPLSTNSHSASEPSYVSGDVHDLVFTIAGGGRVFAKLEHQDQRLHCVFHYRGSLLTIGKARPAPPGFALPCPPSPPPPLCASHRNARRKRGWGVEREARREGNRFLCGSLVVWLREGVLPLQTPFALSSRVLFCSGCPGRDCTSLQCFTPLVTSHQLGGNSF